MKNYMTFQGVALTAVVTIALAACGGGGSGGGDGVVAQKSWGTATLIETDNAGDAYSPQIAVDSSGNALAVWEQSDGTRNNVWACRYTAGVGWGTAELIETNNAGKAVNPQIAIDTSGNALAVWYQYNGTLSSIWANRYTLGVGWGTATLIETDDTGSAGHVQVAYDSSGNALAVWAQYDGMALSIYANRYTAGVGWGMAELIDTDDTGNADYPQVAYDSSGNAFALWQQSDGTRNNIWANRYTAGVGWGTPMLIEADNAASADYPQVAFDSSGNAFAVWQQSDGTRSNIWATRYTATADIGWSMPTLIETDNTGNASSPRVVVDSNGNAFFVWQQSDGTRDNIWSNRYTTGIGWGTATLIETDNSGSAGNVQVAVDNSGHAFAVWQQSDGTQNTHIWANRYTTGVGWGSTELLEGDSAWTGISPQVAFDGSGNALAVWQQYDGSRFNIWANSYR